MVPLFLLGTLAMQICITQALQTPTKGSGEEMVFEIGDSVLVRPKRGSGASDICKYTKGSWSPCNYLTKLEARVDKLKTSSSGTGCPDTRQITRNCKKDKRKGRTDAGKKVSVCQYEKPRDAEWMECQSEVRQKVLKLVTENGSPECPKTKVLSKKCKNVKAEKKGRKEKKERKEKKADAKKAREGKKNKNKNKKGSTDKRENRIAGKCEFGDWSDFSVCDGGLKTRTRQVVVGADTKICRREAINKIKC